MKPPSFESQVINSSNSKTQQITAFNSVTYNTDNTIAIKYLNQSNGDVSKAIENYFDEQEQQSTDSDRSSISNPSSDVIRILVVGITGSGKSSLVNGVTGSTLATSDNANGCTCGYKRQECEYESQKFELIDTAGFGEVSEVGTVKPDVAFKSIQKLVRYSYSGYNLIVFVTTKKKITQTDVDHVKLITEILCKNSIPTVLLVNKSESGANKIDDICQNKWLNDNNGANLNEFYKAFGKDTFRAIQQIAFPKGEKSILQQIREASKRIFFEKVIPYASPTRIVMKHTVSQFLSDCYRTETSGVDGTSKHNFIVGTILLPFLPLMLWAESFEKTMKKREIKELEEEHSNFLVSTLSISKKQAVQIAKESVTYEFSELGSGSWE
ncbi:GTP-binding protein [Naegleria gruberi]|uniref:GTP-binding protein n=1 Tax=Naegleria gruberi TaxID=5762 RepID=D2VZD0_NAEGR|nr:GTP-binding protein [Naegleria gruberi]EFC37769.1 GTP-binding protein [Naegleria gruberi]|eukprot:XP_002670513.1 GTP-binding protein [Naegleria gruberi strain NEG-M]